MGNEFLVVGEYRLDDQWLLVQGVDGRYYSYHPRRKRLMRVKPDEQWVLYTDEVSPEDERHRPKVERETVR